MEVDLEDDEPQTGFAVEAETISPTTSLVVLHGQADLHTAPELRDKVAAAIDEGAQNLVIDLTDATFIDSMTLGVLLGAVKRLRPTGGQMRIVVSSSSIRRIFEITLLDRVFTLCETRDAALAGL
ncbi:MAG: STAS domain-containing protein [Gaiella sp.]